MEALETNQLNTSEKARLKRILEYVVMYMMDRLSLSIKHLEGITNGNDSRTKSIIRSCLKDMKKHDFDCYRNHSEGYEYYLSELFDSFESETEKESEKLTIALMNTIIASNPKIDKDELYFVSLAQHAVVISDISIFIIDKFISMFKDDSDFACLLRKHRLPLLNKKLSDLVDWNIRKLYTINTNVESVSKALNEYIMKVTNVETMTKAILSANANNKKWNNGKYTEE